METAVKRLYEGMFLVDSTQASEWDRVVKTIKKLLDRSDADIVSIRNWAEKKLAYEINHKSRGTYVLCYFKADAEKIKNIEKDVHLSEQIMRVLILGTETRDKDDVEKDMHGLQEVKETPKTDEAGVEKVSPQRETEQADEAGVEKVSPQRETEQADEPEQSDEPVVVDAIGPEQSIEPAFADVIEPEQVEGTPTSQERRREPEPPATEQESTETESKETSD